MKVRVEIDDRRVQAALKRLLEAAGDLSGPMDDVGAALAERVRLTFHDGADPWGDPWAPLKPSTIARRRKRSGVPLRDTGRLMNSIGHRAGSDFVEIGTNVEYAATHQFGARKGRYGKTRRGAPIPWGDVPARPFLPIRDGAADLPQPWREEIVEILSRHLAS